MKAGDSYGKWTLIGDRELGQGGNSIVWRANGPSHAPVAIKFLTRFDRYDRFRDEVRFQHQRSSCPGVLPLLDFHLPDSPSKLHRPWLVTPISIGLREFVEQSDDKLMTAVQSVRDTAQVLADLHAENMAHRDIKPENLFIYNGRAVVGDFGFVTYPDKEATTAIGERLGPIYYVAPELLGNEDGKQDCRPGDVYSLAKTLWVLGSGQRFPLPGHIVASEGVCRLSSFVNHERAVLLDRLIDSSTAINPGKRPSCREFADELEAWLQEKDLPHTAMSIAAPTSARLHQFAELADWRRQERELAHQDTMKVLSYVHEQLVAMGSQLAEAAGIMPRSQRLPDGNTNIALRYFPYTKGERQLGVGNRCFEECFGTTDGKIIVANGSAVLEHRSNSHAVLKGGLVIAANHRPTEIIYQTEYAFRFGTATQESCVNQFLSNLRQHIPDLADRLIEVLDGENRSSIQESL